MNPEEKFKNDMMRRQKKDMHLKFFQEDPSRQYVKVPIFSKLSAKKQILPFRNVDCQKPSCVYDAQDLIDKFKESHMSSLHGFMCYSCDNFIELNKFCLDLTLKKIVDHVWEKYNKPEKIICNGVTVMRDGHWEPNLPEYLKLLDKKQSHRKGDEAKDLYVASADDGKLKTLVEYESPPQLQEFDQNEYKKLLSAFKSSNFDDNDVYLNKEGVPVTVRDIKTLEQEEAISSRIIALFVNYLNLLQKNEKGKFNKKNQNRCYFSALNVVNYDKYYKKSKYEFFFGSKNEYRKDPAKIYENFDKVVLILKYDDRWMCAAIELASNRYYITDFLAEDLSKVKYDEILEVVKEIAQSEFKLNYEIQEFYDHKRLNFLCDCGIYILNYVYKCMNNSTLDSVKVKFMEKDLFQKQLVWLILKMKSLKKKEIQMFEFSESDNRKNPSKGELDSERANRKQSQISANRIKSHSQTPLQSVRNIQSDSSIKFFNFPGEPAFQDKLSPIPNRKSILPALQSTRNASQNSLRNSDSILFNGKGFTTPQQQDIRGSMTSGRKNHQDSSMLELPKSQLQNILNDFRKEVEETVKQEKLKQKEKAKRLKSQSSESYYSEEESSYDDETRDGKHGRASSSGSENSESSYDKSSNTSLPSIYKNGPYPNYGGMPYNGYNYQPYGGYNPYQHQFQPNSYGSPYQNSNMSRGSSKMMSSFDASGDESSNGSMLANLIIKKAKKKDRNKYQDEDLFNYTRDEKMKKKSGPISKKYQKNGRRLDHIQEEDDDLSQV